MQNDPKCEHKHIEGCHDAVCVEYRLVHRAPKIGGAARTALLGWFAVLAERVAGRHVPKHWQKKERKEYLDRIQRVTAAIQENGNRTVFSPVIEHLADKINNVVNNF